MREQYVNNLRDRDSREYRAYRRMIRKRKALERKCILTVLSICLITIGILSFHVISSKASGMEEKTTFKYYTSVTIGYGDSLWTIADRYMDSDYYRDKSAYITEVCQINSLAKDSQIIAGQKLIVPYYSTEYMR